ITVDGESFSASGSRDGHLLHARLDGAGIDAAAFAHEGALHLFAGGAARVLRLDNPLARTRDHDAHAGGLVAPMPGRIVALLAAPGDVVSGTPLMVMEAMKMEHTITAAVDGTLAGFLAATGEQVAEGAALVKFTAGDKT